jgi:Raf kinase inhibitor-like YbhB/YbcL family protein
VKAAQLSLKRALGLVILASLAVGAPPARLARAWQPPFLLTPAPGAPPMAFAISSSSFPNGGDIPRKYTCDGADSSPQLSWTQPPPGTRSFALIADDPDAPGGTWTHWVIFDLPSQTTHLAEAVAKTDELPGGARQGRNDFGKIGYGGPCPPPGNPHRYFFKLFASDQPLGLSPGSTRKQVEKAMQGHILGQTQWVGKYGR